MVAAWLRRWLPRRSRRLGPLLPYRPRFEALEDRLAPATLDVIAGSLTYAATAGVANNLTIGVSGGLYTFTDTGEAIALTPNATAAGWTGGGTNSVSGPVTSVGQDFSVNLQDGADALSVTGPITVSGGVSLESGQRLTLLAAVTTGTFAGLPDGRT